MKNYRYKILIVEDESSIRLPLAEALAKAQFEVISAKDGEEGLRAAKEIKPDIILLDIKMPIMDGMEMLKELRNSGEYGKTVKVIILTSFDADDDILKGITEHMPSYYLLKKDWAVEKAIQKVKEVLGMIN